LASGQVANVATLAIAVPAGVESEAMHRLVGESKGICAVREAIQRLAQRQRTARRLPPILILGETGTGKGLVARVIHASSPRADGPFVPVNCAAIPESLLEAELFGYERGAFTDARQAKPGLFQLAQHGTVLLDEVSLLSLPLQAKLLTAVEERSVRRLGATRDELVDVQIIAAASDDLALARRLGRFREDLYHRLSLLTLALPPLRERGDDLDILAEHLLQRVAENYGLGPMHFAREALDGLRRHAWPGNVRELANVIERGALLADGGEITAAALVLDSPLPPRAHSPGAPERGRAAQATRWRAAGVDPIVAALEATGGNVVQAAARLGIPRNTLRYRMRCLGLAPAGDGSTPSPADGGSAPIAAPRWEHRSVALLRIRLLGDDEWPASTSARRLERMADTVRAFGGRLESRGAATLLASFGTTPTGDEPERAAHAALATVTAVQDDGPSVGVQAALHLATVPLAVDPEGTRIDADVLRRTMTDIDALVAEAEPNTVVVAESARALLSRKFVLVADPRGPGRPALRLVHRPRAAFDHRGRLTAFVGRQRELDVLDGELAVAASGRGRVVGIVGDAGIGKSRLAWEFRQHVAGAAVGCIAGHCVPQGGAIPYLPVLDLLRDHAGLSEPDPLGTVVERLSKALHQAGLDPGPRLPFLLRLLGVRDRGGGLDDLSPEVLRARTFDAVVELFVGASTVRALAVFIEDLHWIDRTSEEWLGALVERLSGSRFLVVATYRPGYQPRWIDRSYATQVSLAPLGREDSARVVEAILGDSAGALVGPVLVRAEGNPFFLEELAIAIRDHAGLEADPTIPATIDEVVGGRIDRLGDEPRRLLGAAAVLGREFSRELLAAVWGDSLDPHADALVRQEFLLPRAAAERGYVFKHPLTQEIAYARLEPAERQRLHGRAGEALEAQAGHGAEVVDRLAHHWARTDDAARAVTWLVRFADHAARGSSHEEAVAALETAREHAGRLPEAERDGRRMDVVMRLARSLALLGRIGEALTRVAAEGPGVHRLDDRRLTGRFAFLLGNLHCLRGNLGEARDWAARAVADAEAAGDVVTLGRACQVMAYERWWSGRPREGITWGQRSVACLERSGNRGWLGAAHWSVSVNHYLLGALGPAREHLRRILTVADELADPRLLMLGSWWAGFLAAEMGDGETAVAEAERALGLVADTYNRAQCVGFLGYAYLTAGDVGRAIGRLDEGLTLSAEAGVRPHESWFGACLAEAWSLGGAPARAQALAQRALDLAREIQLPWVTGVALRALGRAALVLRDVGTAERALGEALAAFGAIPSAVWIARTRLDLGALALARGDQTSAVAHLGEARAVAANAGLSPLIDRIDGLLRAS
jgi:DNA-binding NtrC family response regulator/tetratricopeptide (TPR) repeat protein